MAKNLEIKARIHDRTSVEARAAAAAGGPPVRLIQRDTFFHVPRGRLKLREEEGRAAELVYYEREDLEGPKPSFYLVTPVPDPAPLRASLERCLGIRGRVEKERTLYRSGRTRIHLDRVRGLGDFLELEVRMEPGEGEGAARKEAERLMKALGVAEEDLLRGAYLDLLEKQER